MKKKVRYKRKEVMSVRRAFFSYPLGKLILICSELLSWENGNGHIQSSPEWTVFVEIVPALQMENHLPSLYYQRSPETQDFPFLEKYCISPALLVKILLVNSFVRIFPEGKC